MGDASNCHRCLAEGLRRRGHNVTVASDGTLFMKTERDVDISRRWPGKPGGLELWLRARRLANSDLSGHDIVSITGPCFIGLRPNRIRDIYDRLCRSNGHIFITALGTDPQYVSNCQAGVLSYSEWSAFGQSTPFVDANPGLAAQWLTPELTGLSQYLYDTAEGVVAVLYEYYKSCASFLPVDKLSYGGIPVDTRTIKFTEADTHGRKIRLMLGRHKHRILEKGTDMLLDVMQRLVNDYPDRFESVVVENVTYAEFLHRLEWCDIYFDQFYSYTPATSALLAMAMGKVVVTGGDDEFYNFIGEKELRPIIAPIAQSDDFFKARCESVYNAIANLSDQPDEIARLSAQSRRFVERHNDVDIVASRFMDFWTSKING